MDLFYDILEELSGNPSANEATNENSVEQEEGRRRNSRMEQNPTERNAEEGRQGDLSFFDASGEFGSDSAFRPREDSREWESHTKNIQGEFSKASNPGQHFKISKDIDLDSFAPREGWLNLDELELQTSPSQFPPPSRPAPSRGTASSPSTSGREYTERQQQGEAKTEDLEHYLTKISIKRRLSYELVEEDVYGDQSELADHMHDAGRQTKQPEEDLIDISTVDLNDKVVEDKVASEQPGNKDLEKRVGKVTKAIEEDLSALFGDNSVPTSSNKTTTADRKGKGVVSIGGDNGGARKPSAAVATMKERDMKRQREMEEIEKAADELGAEFKKWSAGKEGNLRALLSSLQNILGPEFEWQPVPMTELLESASVKRQYKRATLLVHPDKLQQKGATPRQKYIAEKVFGLLKEASKKFNSEELF